MCPVNALPTIEVIRAVDAVSAEEWDALAGPDDPFSRHAFLHALERSGSVGPGTGWQPVHLLARDADSQLVGALPLYLKHHSYGEYIFDWGWASAAQRAGIPYYPKLVNMVPLTPATGRRLLRADGVPLAFVAPALVQGALELCDRISASSVHFNFLSAAERDAVCAADPRVRPRLSMQFHWDNKGYASFDDFLAEFRAPLRKQVRKERKRAQASGLDIRIVPGSELTARDISALHSFYADTCMKRGSGPYLTPQFFQELRDGALRESALAVLAYRSAEPVAGTLNFQRGKHLYGRYWGCLEEFDALHFECCYYALLEYAIEHKLTHFEAGAQGTHKLRRGLMPTEIHSAHYVAHPGLADAVANFLPEEAFAVRQEIADLTNHGPFRRG